MTNFAALALDGFYLIQETESESISLVEVVMETNNAVLLNWHEDEYEHLSWRKKIDPIFELVDELTDEQVTQYEDLFEEEDDEEEEGFDFDDIDFDDEEEEKEK